MWNIDKAHVINVWPEAEHLEDSVYSALMTSAHELCAAYAPSLQLGYVIPESWKLAEILQARDIWNQTNAGNRDEFGPDGMTIPVTRLNYLAQDLLRPKSSALKRLR